MKISMMTNDQAADAMLKLAEPMSRLMEDKETIDILKGMQQEEKEGGFAFFGRVLPRLVSYCMKDHKMDVYAIVAALTMKPVTAVGNMNFMETVKELRESIDEDFIGFFRSSGNVTDRPGKE